jgi:VWFA-related protein
LRFVAFLAIRGGAVIVAVWAICVPGLAGQSQTFRARTDLIQLDVSVIDAAGRPVRNLTSDDFRILEDGVPRPIAAFASVDLAASAGRAATSFPKIALDVQRNDLDDQRLVVIYLDAFALDLAGLRTAKQIGHAIVDRLGPSDLTAIVLAGLDDQAQDLTTDRGRLHAAVDRLNWSGSPDRLVVGLRLVIDQLERVSNRRKIVFLVSRGVPFDADLLQPMLVTFGQGGAQGAMSDLYYRMQGILLAAERANVNIYAIDPSGLAAPASGADINPGRQFRDFLQIVSNQTGGRAIIDTNAPETRVAPLLAENDAYYLLGFRPGGAMDGRFRRLTVQVTRPGVQVRARSGYFAVADPPAEPPSTAARLAELLPRTDLSMGVSVIPFVAPGSGTPSVAWLVRVDLPASADARSEALDIEMRALDVEGRVHATTRREARFTIRPNAPAAVQIVSRAEIRPGRYQVRVAARAAGLGVDGSVFSDVEVPDYSRQRVSMSGVLIGGAEPDVPTVPRDVLADLSTAIVPTLRREFRSDERITASVRIYQGGTRPLAPVRVTGRIVRPDDTITFESADIFDPPRFETSRSAEYLFPLPLAQLSSGAHRLAIEAQLERTTARRDVVFAVR